jgi:hypothetical protein
MKGPSYVRLAEHINSVEKRLTGAGNSINVTKKAAYTEYIKVCYTSHVAYLAPYRSWNTTRINIAHSVQ